MTRTRNTGAESHSQLLLRAFNHHVAIQDATCFIFLKLLQTKAPFNTYKLSVIMEDFKVRKDGVIDSWASLSPKNEVSGV
jgi:hypothetical protein